MMQLTGQNRFTKSLSGDYKMTNGSRVRKLLFRTEEAIKESIVHESTELTVDEGVEDGESIAMPRSSAMSDVFIVLFYISYRTSDLFAK